MIPLLLGAVTLFVLMGAMGMFSRAQISTIKTFGLWTLGIGALAAAALLFLTGRVGVAIAALGLVGPLLWSWGGLPGSGGRGMGAGRRPAGRSGARPATRSNAMTRMEAFEVLGLTPGASEAEIRAAYMRLMRTAHPDAGGSAWLAARLNQARDVLLG